MSTKSHLYQPSTSTLGARDAPALMLLASRYTLSTSRSLSRSTILTNSEKSSISFTGSGVGVDGLESRYLWSIVGGLPPRPPVTWLVHTAVCFSLSMTVTVTELARVMPVRYFVH